MSFRTGEILPLSVGFAVTNATTLVSAPVTGLLMEGLGTTQKTRVGFPLLRYPKETMQLSSIIFDMDGVLIDLEPVHK